MRSGLHPSVGQTEARRKAKFCSPLFALIAAIEVLLSDGRFAYFVVLQFAITGSNVTEDSIEVTEKLRQQ